MPATLDLRDVVYLVGGLAFLGLTVLPLLSGLRLVSVPTLYVGAGALLVWSPVPWPVLDPAQREGSLAIMEHASELIVIIALAGAGLAVDRREGWRTWQHTWALLAITMPLTILACVALGVWGLGLGLPAAVLLGAVLAPTDPVLARSVQVEGPHQGEEDDVRVALTTEAGLNDGLAFPFVHLAVAWAAAAATEAGLRGYLTWRGLGHWAWFDLGYRVVMAAAVGWAIAWLVAKLLYSRYGDAQRGGENTGLVLVGTTCLAYGATEAIDAYGFLAVFLCARIGRHYARRADQERYAQMPHQFSDQIEKILLALMLVWMGSYLVGGGLTGVRVQEAVAAAALLLIIRPAAGVLGLWRTRGSGLERFAIAALGIRGIGSIFYLCHAQAQATFAGIDAVWRVTLLTLLGSIVLHGVAAPVIMQRLHARGLAAADPATP